MFPEINIFGIKIGTYGLCVILAAVMTTFLVINKSKKKNIDWLIIMVIASFVFGFALVGAKLLYIVVTYSPSMVWSMILNRNFEFFTGGGFVFYGGLLGGIIGAFIGGKTMMIKLSYIEDCIIPFIPLAHAVGRVGCFMAGCCYGIPYDGFCAIPYGKNITGHAPDETIFPVQLLEAFMDVLICLFLLYYSKKQRGKYDVLFMYLALYGVLRFSTEFLRGDVIRGFALGLSTSQWISIGIIVVCLVRFVLKKSPIFEKNT